MSIMMTEDMLRASEDFLSLGDSGQLCLSPGMATGTPPRNTPDRGDMGGMMACDLWGQGDSDNDNDEHGQVHSQVHLLGEGDDHASSTEAWKLSTGSTSSWRLGMESASSKSGSYRDVLKLGSSLEVLRCDAHAPHAALHQTLGD
jgi:hypothetical protein